MDLVARPRRLSGLMERLARRLRHWRAGRHEAEALRVLLDKRDDRLLDDAGIGRETGHELLGETLFLPGREWDRWQL